MVITNDEMEKLNVWLTANRLSLNIGKTHYMVFNPHKQIKPPNIAILINNTVLEEVNECKFLGVILYNELSWKSHCLYISRKIAKSIDVISKVRKVLCRESLITLYYSLMYPYILYCNVIWGNANKAVLWPIFKIQKQAVRLINNLNRYDSTQSSFKEMNLLRLPDVYKLCHHFYV